VFAVGSGLSNFRMEQRHQRHTADVLRTLLATLSSAAGPPIANLVDVGETLAMRRQWRRITRVVQT